MFSISQVFQIFFHLIQLQNDIKKQIHTDLKIPWEMRMPSKTQGVRLMAPSKLHNHFQKIPMTVSSDQLDFLKNNGGSFSTVYGPCHRSTTDNHQSLVGGLSRIQHETITIIKKSNSSWSDYKLFFIVWRNLHLYVDFADFFYYDLCPLTLDPVWLGFHPHPCHLHLK